jgi:hypothetical protein
LKWEAYGNSLGRGKVMPVVLPGLVDEDAGPIKVKNGLHYVGNFPEKPLSGSLVNDSVINVEYGLIRMWFAYGHGNSPR